MTTNNDAQTIFHRAPRAFFMRSPGVTLNAKIRVFIFFGDFGLRDTFQERIAPKVIEIDMDIKLRIKFSALNVGLDVDGASLDFLGSRKPAYEGIKERYPRISRYFTLLAIFGQNGCR